MYPVPPQLGQSFGLTPLSPSSGCILGEMSAEVVKLLIALRIPNKNLEIQQLGRHKAKSKRRLDVLQLQITKI